jgi:hypothetical protein
MAHTCNQEAEIKRIEVQGQPRKIFCDTPISKITRAKWTRGVAHVVECLQMQSPEFKPSPSLPLQLKKKGVMANSVATVI